MNAEGILELYMHRKQLSQAPSVTHIERYLLLIILDRTWVRIYVRSFFYDGTTDVRIW